MLRIFKNQMEAFAEEAREDFRDRAVAHVERRFHKHWRHLGKAQIEEVVDAALERAGENDFTLERTIVRYLEVVFIVGSGFARDPQYPWVAEILAGDFAHETARANRLHERALEYAQHALKDFRDDSLDKSRFVAQLRRIRREPDSPLDEDFSKRLAKRLKDAFPNKWAHLGEAALDAHVARTIGSARDVGLDTQRGTIIMSTLMTVLGGGFATDPLVPWAAPILEDENLKPPAKADALFDEALDQLQRWMRAT